MEYKLSSPAQKVVDIIDKIKEINKSTDVAILLEELIVSFDWLCEEYDMYVSLGNNNIDPAMLSAVLNAIAMRHCDEDMLNTKEINKQLDRFNQKEVIPSLRIGIRR